MIDTRKKSNYIFNLGENNNLKTRNNNNCYFKLTDNKTAPVTVMTRTKLAGL